MNKLLLASALLAFTAAASAQSTAPAVDAQVPSDATEATGQDEAFADRLCLRQTGSRIIATRHLRSRDDAKECVASNGRVYTRADIDSTGAVDLADALRRLDPSIR